MRIRRWFDSKVIIAKGELGFSKKINNNNEFGRRFEVDEMKIRDEEW